LTRTHSTDGKRELKEKKVREKRIKGALSSGHLGRPLLVSASSHKKKPEGLFLREMIGERFPASFSATGKDLHKLSLSLRSLSGITGHARTSWLTALIWTL